MNYKPFIWDIEKNQKLKYERGIGFEDIIQNIFNGNLKTIVKHPNQKRYPGQNLFIVEISDYIYVVPYIEDKNKIFLKTLYPSRVWTKQIIEKGGS